MNQLYKDTTCLPESMIPISIDIPIPTIDLTHLEEEEGRSSPVPVTIETIRPYYLKQGVTNLYL